MRALRFHAAGDLRIDEVREPPAPAAGEVLVAPVVCGICGTDLHEYRSGPLRTSVEPHPVTGGRVPQILGHELAGDVVAVGEGVNTVAPGDRVSVMPLVTCERCLACSSGRKQHCDSRAAVGLRHPWGGMAPLALVSERQVARLPASVSFDQGALVEPAAVAVAALDAGGARSGDDVVVFGAGPIGALAALAGAGTAANVLIVEPHPGRAARMTALGFDVVDPDAIDIVAACRKRRRAGVDLAIECSGSASALRAALAAVASGGRVVQAGLVEHPVEIDAMDLTLRGVSLVGSVGYPLDAWPGLLDRIAAGTLPAERIVTGRVALEDAVSAGFERLAAGANEVKLLVEVA